MARRNCSSFPRAVARPDLVGDVTGGMEGGAMICHGHWWLGEMVMLTRGSAHRSLAHPDALEVFHLLAAVGSGPRSPFLPCRQILRRGAAWIT